MNKYNKSVLIGLILLAGILIYIYGVSADGSNDGREDNSGSGDREDFSRDNSNSGALRTRENERTLRIEREIRIRNEDGTERKVRFELRREERNGEIRERIKFSESEIEAESELEIEDDSNRTSNGTLRARLSNGRRAEIKVMPETASERALERLRLKVCREEDGCTIVLKEIGEGEEIKAAYEISAEEDSRVLGLFKAKLKLRSSIDAETGEIINVERPWWAFMARYENQEINRPQ